MAVDIMGDYELEKLRMEIQQERQMREMLEQSSSELQVTIEELEKRFDTLEDEGNEWKTRFETQEEMNQQLERQIVILQSKVDEGRQNLKEAIKTPRDPRHAEDLNDPSPQIVASLERDQQLLINQLRDLEWRLDQESKAYHKANDERKQSVLEINATRGNINDLRSRQKEQLIQQNESSKSIKSFKEYGNIPENQRILDAKHGPIKKTAAVKTLPSLD